MKKKIFRVYSHSVDALHKDPFSVELCESAYFDFCDYIEETLCADVSFFSSSDEERISFNSESDFFRCLGFFMNHQSNIIDYQRNKITEITSVQNVF